MKTKFFFFRIILIPAFVFFVIQGCDKVENQPDPVNGDSDSDPVLLDCNYFASDRILEDDPDRPVDFIVPCVANVTAKIVVKAGVVIEFEDDAGLNVSTGSLKVEGTQSAKVVFTGATKVKGSWRGIFITSKSVNNIFDHAIISYGGGNSFNSNNDRGNLICYNGMVKVTNTEISMGKEHGFNCVYSAGEIVEFSNNTITGNDKYPVISLTKYGFNYDSSNDFSGNGLDYIFLEGNFFLGDDHTWQKTNVPYLIDGKLRIGDDESLTLEAGATLLFEDASSIGVEDGGYLAAMGVQDKMVTLSGLTEQPGSWLGIINYSDDIRNVIDFTEIAYAGGGAHNSNGDLGTIVVWANASQTVKNSILRDAAPSAECAIFHYPTATLSLSENTISNITNESCN
jgi:hypothetical protein